MVEACYTDTQDYSKCVDTTSLGTNTGLTFVTGTPAAGQVSVTGTANTYTITAKSNSNNFFYIDKNASGSISRTCGPTGGVAACPANKSW